MVEDSGEGAAMEDSICFGSLSCLILLSKGAGTAKDASAAWVEEQLLYSV